MNISIPAWIIRLFKRKITSATNADKIVRELLSREMQDGKSKRNDPYWTSDGHNVGNDVSAAARIAVDTIQMLCNTKKSVSIETIIGALRETSVNYQKSARDPDGFGMGTFVSIIQNLSTLASTMPGAAISSEALPILAFANGSMKITS